uniref:Putative secreted protein n=1 Tax=Ixodes ricinus TaxID=34613 RepID=A0A6B0U9C8_IXORI
MILAPSMCTGILVCLLNSVTLLRCSMERTVPLQTLCVFSRQIRDVLGQWKSRYRTLRARSSMRSEPSGCVGTAQLCTAAICATFPCSFRKICDASPTRISCPLWLQ